MSAPSKMNIENAKDKIRNALHGLTQLPCELPPDNKMTRKQLDEDKQLDSVSIFGQYIFLDLLDALKELEGK
jgi:hypothetical protein